MTADASRRVGSHGLTWGGLRTTRTTLPEVVIFTRGGHERLIEIRTQRELLDLLKAGFDCLSRIEQAEEIRRAHEVGRRDAETMRALDLGGDS